MNSNIERWATGSCLLVTEHRYGFGFMAAMCDYNQLSQVEALATDGGDYPTIFAGYAEQTLIPVAFGRTLTEALERLDTRLAVDECHHPAIAWQVLEEVIREHGGLSLEWHEAYAKHYSAWTGGAQ